MLGVSWYILTYYIFLSNKTEKQYDLWKQGMGINPECSWCGLDETRTRALFKFQMTSMILRKSSGLSWRGISLQSWVDPDEYQSVMLQCSSVDVVSSGWFDGSIIRTSMANRLEMLISTFLLGLLLNKGVVGSHDNKRMFTIDDWNVNFLNWSN